jgi:hypothetical protein
MKKQLILLSAIIMSLFMITLISSEIQYYQQRFNRGNGIIENRATLTYSKSDEFGFANDYVLASNPLEVYLQYNIYVKTFNNNNPNHLIDYCNLTIRTWKRIESNATIVFNQTYTSNDLDINKAQYFYQLSDGDQAIAVESCKYNNPVDSAIFDLQLPAEMQMVMPTTECKSCQYYLWTTQNADIIKAESIGNNIVRISSYVQRLIILNFEIILALFWVMLILMIFVGIGLIFVVGYWIFLYLWRIAK